MGKAHNATLMTQTGESRVSTHEGAKRAAGKIGRILPPTPLLPLEIGGAGVWLKAESLQPVGSFKIRGAWHRLSDLSAEERARGVVAVSSGNHAQGVAWAAKRLAIAARIVMPHDAPPVKREHTLELGATIIGYDRMSEDREAIARKLADDTGAAYVHAYADPWVIEGQGSAGIEITEQLGRQPSRILACCGGGGLSAGLALACPESEIIPVEPEGWDDVCRSLASGSIEQVGLDPPQTACDALQTFATRPINFAILKERCTRGLTVSEAQVRAAQRLAFTRARLVLEPGGAVALAAALANEALLDPNTVIMLTGGNVDPQAFARVIEEA